MVRGGPIATTDTIFAPATAAGRAAICVIRLSGAKSGPAVRALAGSLPAPRSARRRRLVDPESGQPLDEALVLWFPERGGRRSASFACPAQNQARTGE